MRAVRCFSLCIAFVLIGGCSKPDEQGSRFSQASSAVAAPAPALATCEEMCDHAVRCKAARVGAPFEHEVVQDGLRNCIAGCRGGPADRIACWTKAPCERIESEQGLTRKECP